MDEQDLAILVKGNLHLKDFLALLTRRSPIQGDVGFILKQTCRHTDVRISNTQRRCCTPSLRFRVQSCVLLWQKSLPDNVLLGKHTPGQARNAPQVLKINHLAPPAGFQRLFPGTAV